MQFRLEPLLSSGQVGELRLALLAKDAPWRDGAETAGWHAREVKRNRQLEPASSLHQTLASALSDHLLQHPLLQAAALPVRLHSLRFSRCGVGEGYGRHVDNAFMAGGRSDLSFTLFLSEPEQYDGGALVLEDPGGECALRLPAGHALVYPSSLLHRVEPVTRGERLVAVGWIQSRVRRSDRRELLFELDTARRALFQKQGKDEIFDLLTRSYTNLLRMWGE
ncbi:Fe(II)-dependent oxygenase superfamily protein [Cyanobium sp. Copco_Reservoir_LC18]|jgi:PKHD-type hydroxylase|uniref:Fe2+-dependent dioxygenase n=1 Tax=Cyanobium sp. Copco_Reservoir_LC18 TaxID=1328305 RepID=UPI001358811F|nr:Fe2+-dependent dioxygenase [Cyanobium sp. Copco_Reservoir_LC18]KAF0654314.1 Fe(II)-dependent oxygenase superfamily protein [Cyanobium sp. Copco_Reservoir_LC18]